MIGLKLAAVFLTLGVVGGYAGGTIAATRAPVACVDALDRADKLMNDMAEFGKSTVVGLGTIIGGGTYVAAPDPVYARMMAGVAPYKAASAICRGGR